MAGIVVDTATLKIGGGYYPVESLIQTAVVPAPLARWTFSESAAPFYSTASDLPLQIGSGTIASGHSAGTNLLQKITTPHGGGVQLGGQNWLTIPAASVGRLNVGASTGQVTVSCWFRNEDTNGGAIAGIWKEDNAAPGRSYCLFYDLPYYNGDEKVCGHVSKYGGATPGYPYSKDYSASLETISRAGVWEHYAFTYDGARAISYLNGQGSYLRSQGFVDNDGNTLNEDKNPYYFNIGLNNNSAADFTLGAVKLTAGMGNLVRGVVADLRIWNTALTPQQMSVLYATT